MTEEIMTTGEKFYCLIQDIEEYIQHNSLEQDKELDFILSQSKELQLDYARIEQENKELRQQYNCYACDTCQGKEDYRNMKRHCENAIKTVHTYRSALEEIREIVSDEIDKTDSDDELMQIYGTIYNKINEVLN